MADNNYASIAPLNNAAQKEGMPLVGKCLLFMVITFVAAWIVGEIANLLL